MYHASRDSNFPFQKLLLSVGFLFIRAAGGPLQSHAKACAFFIRLRPYEDDL